MPNTTVIGRLGHLEDEFMHYRNYQWGCNQALAQMMQAPELYMGVDLETFPTLPTNPYDTVQQDAGANVGGDIEEEEEWCTW